MKRRKEPKSGAISSVLSIAEDESFT